MLDELVSDKSLQARGVYGFWPAHAEGDDVVLDGTRFCFLRQQADHGDGRPNRCLADYVAPDGDHVGAFAVAIHGADEVAARHVAEHDDYKAIIVKALADRLAEAFAEWLHQRARREWYAPDEVLAADTCSPSASAASGPRSATRPARITARSRSSSTCSARVSSGSS